MYLAYGGYVHAAGEVTISINKTVLRSDVGTRIGFTEQWTIKGVLQAADVPSLTNALALLEAAYSFDGNNLVLFNDDGSTSQHFLLAANSQGGTRVVRFGYPDGDGAEYTTFRRYEIVVEGRFVAAPQNLIVAWTETLTFTGDGGPRFIMQQPLRGFPIPWQVAEHTPFLATQVGTAIMFGTYPNPPGPLFPNAEHRDRRKIGRVHPQIINGTLQNYGTSWSYEFESTTPLFGAPTPPRN